MKKILLSVILVLGLVGCGTSGGDTTYVQEAPLEPAVPTNGTNIVVNAEGESNVGLTYTEVGAGAILVECGDNCDLDVYEATKIEPDETDCPVGFVWCPIEKKCIPE